MSRFTAIHRGAAAVGASGLIALSLAGPAAARPDPDVLPSCRTACNDAGISWPGAGPSRSGAGPLQILRVDDNAVEYVQLGAGVLAGAALAGAGMALASRRRHHPHPRAA